MGMDLSCGFQSGRSSGTRSSTRREMGASRSRRSARNSVMVMAAYALSSCQGYVMNLSPSSPRASGTRLHHRRAALVTEGARRGGVGGVGNDGARRAVALAVGAGEAARPALGVVQAAGGHVHRRLEVAELRVRGIVPE